MYGSVPVRQCCWSDAGRPPGVPQAASCLCIRVYWYLLQKVQPGIGAACRILRPADACHILACMHALIFPVRHASVRLLQHMAGVVAVQATLSLEWTDETNNIELRHTTKTFCSKWSKEV